MSTPAVQVPADAKPRRRWLRFSLRTLLLVTLTIAAAGVVKLHWEPWVLETKWVVPDRLNDKRKIRGDNRVTAVVFSADDSRVLVGNRNGMAWMFDRQTGKVMLSLPHEWEVTAAEFEREGGGIITATDSQEFHWNLKGEMRREAVRYKSRSPDGKLAIELDKAYKTNLIELPGGAIRFSYGDEHACCFSPDGRKVVTRQIGPLPRRTGPMNGWLRLRDVSTGAETDNIAYAPYFWQSYDSSAPETLQFSRDGKKFLIATNMAPPQLWNIERHEVKVLSLNPAKDRSRASLSADGSRAVTSSGIWDTDTATLLYADKMFGSAQYLSNNGNHIACIESEENKATGRWELMLKIFQRRQPEWWWGVACLPEFCLAVVLLIGVIWSVRRDWREVGAT